VRSRNAYEEDIIFGADKRLVRIIAESQRLLPLNEGFSI
jgi:hypothetical protein